MTAALDQTDSHKVEESGSKPNNKSAVGPTTLDRLAASSTKSGDVGKNGCEAKRQRTPSFTPKAESAIERDASNDRWPAFSVTGLNMQTLVVANWSTLWTVQHLRKYILEPVQGESVSISEDGSKAYLSFNTQLAAVQARALCLEACRQVRERGGVAARCEPSETVVSKVEQWLPQSPNNLAHPCLGASALGHRQDPSVAFGEEATQSHSCFFREEDESEDESDQEDVASEASAGDCQAPPPAAIREDHEEELEENDKEPSKAQAALETNHSMSHARQAHDRQDFSKLTLVCCDMHVCEKTVPSMDPLGDPLARAHPLLWDPDTDICRLRRDIFKEKSSEGISNLKQAYDGASPSSAPKTRPQLSPSLQPCFSPPPSLKTAPGGFVRKDCVDESPDLVCDNMSLSHISGMSCGSERGLKASASVARCVMRELEQTCDDALAYL